MADTKSSAFNMKNAFIALSLITSAFLIYDIVPEANTDIPLGALPITEPELKYGMALDTFITKQDTVAENQFISDILLANNVSYNKMTALLTAGKDIFDVRSFRAGKSYTFLSKDTTTTPDYFVYDASPYKYYLFDMKEDSIKEVKKKVEYRVKFGSGVIETSLSDAIVKDKLEKAGEIITKMDNAFGYDIDFRTIQKGDQFKLVYVEEVVDGVVVGIGKLHAALMESHNKPFFAFNYHVKGNENTRPYEAFFDEDGETMKKQFLRSPLEAGYITSGFNPRRFHPIDKRVKAHNGTDYAAPRGTPIRAVANGIVTKSSRTRGNGNYVKLKHNKSYSTQYLHMQRFAKGIKPGTLVKQGETIGYVGSTGKATGPHVCFRFWKNGRQVDHLKLNFPPAEAMPEAEKSGYLEIKDSMMIILDSIPFKQLIEDEVSEKDMVSLEE